MAAAWGIATKYVLAIRCGRAPEKAVDSCTGHRRANFVTGKAREGGGLAEPAVDRAQRSRGRKAPARPATQDREGVYSCACRLSSRNIESPRRLFPAEIFFL